jgi:hypothetical protein
MNDHDVARAMYDAGQATRDAFQRAASALSQGPLEVGES